MLLHRRSGAAGWTETRMEALGNDRWRAAFTVGHLGTYDYTVLGWVDHFASWRRDLVARAAAATQTDVDLLIGAGLIEAAAARASGPRRDPSRGMGGRAPGRRRALPHGRSSPSTTTSAGLMERHPDRRFATRHEVEYAVSVEPVRARFSAWYELFPRSTSPDPSRAGTLRDVVDRLDYVAGLGFDVLYLPPIHPIGLTFRKGPNNVTTASPDDPGRALGDRLGRGWAHRHPPGPRHARGPSGPGRRGRAEGHLGRHRHRVPGVARPSRGSGSTRAGSASRPDGTIQYAENPPKKYQDIYPFDFETEDWLELWDALLGVIRFWIGQGVRIFRVDNPHTKPFPFWEWLIGEIKRDDPDVLFLAEAFTRPKVMYRLAKLGFSQSYTYFTWRTTKQELTEYFTELTDRRRPRVLPAEPLAEHARHPPRDPPARRPADVPGAVRPRRDARGELRHLRPAVRAAARTSPREPGTEEYLDSEKYEVRALGPRGPALDRAADPRRQPDPARASGAPVERAARVPRRSMTTSSSPIRSGRPTARTSC